MSDTEIGFPDAVPDEREQLLAWLAYLRGAVLRKTQGLTDDQADWTPHGRLIPLKGILNHLTRVEWRWIDGAMFGADIARDDGEFRPGRSLDLASAVAAYRDRAQVTDAAVRSFASLAEPCQGYDGEGKDLRWVLLHLINETARHAGHADATRELLDGATGE